MTFEKLEKYLRDDFGRVSGWCSAQLWQVFQPVLEIQQRMGIVNPIAEIGVFQGKFFLGLLASKEAPRANYAIDVFDMQQFNLDGSGDGNLNTLLENIDRCGFSRGQVTALRADSTTITSRQIDEIRTDSKGFSLFSVDGCHLPEHTINDLNIAIQLTIPEGIIFIDDYTNMDWPGVQEAIHKHFFNSYSRFVPLAVAHNKLMLCHIGYHKGYLAAVRERLNAMKIAAKPIKLFGYDAVNVHLDPSSKEFVYRT